MPVEVLIEYQDGTREKRTVNTNDSNDPIVQKAVQELKSRKPWDRYVTRSESNPNFGTGFGKE